MIPQTIKLQIYGLTWTTLQYKVPLSGPFITTISMARGSEPEQTEIVQYMVE